MSVYPNNCKENDCLYSQCFTCLFSRLYAVLEWAVKGEQLPLIINCRPYRRSDICGVMRLIQLCQVKRCVSLTKTLFFWQIDFDLGVFFPTKTKKTTKALCTIQQYAFNNIVVHTKMNNISSLLNCREKAKTTDVLKRNTESIKSF